MNGDQRTAEGYPSECTISDAELRELADALTDEDNEDWRSYVEEWPPTDDMGNVYDIWFTVDELNYRGECIDHCDNNFNPFAGNLQPKIREDIDGKYCNAPLDKWRHRYPNIRFCSIYVDPKLGYDTYCYTHQNRETMQSAEEHLQTGLWTKTVDHLYEKVGPWKKLVGWGTFESLMGESTYEFAPEAKERAFDFSDEDFIPDGADSENILHVECHYPTDHVQPAMALYVAAMQQVQMMSVQPRIMWEGTREDGTEEGMMETKSVEKAQLTAPPSEHDSSPQQFKTIETWNEHHLNLPLSRLIKDQPRLLEMGGVLVDPESEDDGIASEDLVLEVEANMENTETTDETATDPNSYGEDYTAESEKIAAMAGDSEDQENNDNDNDNDKDNE